jgi:hypothetical protein
MKFSELPKTIQKCFSTVPRTEETARARVRQVLAYAERSNIPYYYRLEGEVFSVGISIYPSFDPHNIGLFFFAGRKLTGWHYSLIVNKGYDWSHKR